jgi:CubicO group peptidase (beta-lactamase class C family)
MKTQVISFFLFVLTLLWAISPSALTKYGITSAQVPNSSQRPSLDARILHVENGLSPQASESKSSNSKFKLTDRMKFYKTPGVSVAVINNGTIEWARGYGVREEGRTDPVTPETLGTDQLRG